MTYDSSTSPAAAGPVVLRQANDGISGLLQEWQLLGRVRSSFIEQMKAYPHCPVDISYNVYSNEAQHFANDFAKALSDARWNVTLSSALKTSVGVKIVTKSSALHVEEISAIVKWFRNAGISAKVRVRAELETEAIQIEIGSMAQIARGL
ncbi:MAG TPA: hypothetical protein PK869_14980 [Candidatus Hydrogenedentes bacterium]|nr:hypothetical protein [Candidatus Hydrogenedentota bacterium]